MAVDERSRHALYEQLQRALGDPHADTLMSYLPPVGWADVATVGALSDTEGRLDAKIDHVAERLDAKIDRVEERLTLRMDGLRDELTAAFRQELVAQTRAIMVSSVGLSLSVGGLVLAAARLA